MCKTVRCIRRFSVLCSGAATIEVSSTKMDMNSLIREVSLRPPLWDRKSIHHHNRYALDKLWNEVAVKLNVSRKYNNHLHILNLTGLMVNFFLLH